MRHRLRLYIHTNGHRTQVVANTTTSVVTFSILSPDASLSYDRIKMRLDEYRTLLASDSDTIELATENGKTVLCRKQANEMEEFLDQAEILLQDVIQSRDISTLVVLHHLRDLAEVLDNLKLYDECRLTGNCALDLAEALGRRSVEFRHEQAETLVIIARLSVYQPRARTLFIQAVSICEEVVADDPSHSNKFKHLLLLHTAGYWADEHPELCVHWLGRAVQLITNELPSTMVMVQYCFDIYNNYGVSLFDLKQNDSATKAFQVAISHSRTLAKDDPVRYTCALVGVLMNMGRLLGRLGIYDEAVATFKEAVGLCRALSALYPLQYNSIMSEILCCYALALLRLKRVSEAAELAKEASSLLRVLTETGKADPTDLCSPLVAYGSCCHLLGQHEEAVLACRELISLLHTRRPTDRRKGVYLMHSLHNMAVSLHALGRNAEADAAATEALQINHGGFPENCWYALDPRSCFVCQRTVTSDPSIPSLSLSAIPPRISLGRKRDKILMLFRRNRA